MRALITCGSKRGGTEGIGRMLAEALRQEGVDAEVQSPTAADPRGYDAVIVGGALYANRWHRDARRFVVRHQAELRAVPTWFFSSGPLDDSAAAREIPPPARVAALMDSVGAQGHVTFGGRLASDAKGFPASAMAKKAAGDFRRPDRVRAWAAEIAAALPNAEPKPIVEPAGGSLGRALGFACLAGAAYVALEALLSTGTAGVAARVAFVVLAPIVSGLVASRYFRAPGARAPLPVAAGFAVVAALLELAFFGGAIPHRFEIARSSVASWLPLALSFLATWAVGEFASMMPSPRGPRRPQGKPGAMEPGARAPARRRALRPAD